MVDFKNFSIAAIIVVTLAIIVLIGIGIIGGYSEILRTKTIGANVTGITVAAVNVTFDIGTAATYPFVYAVTLCENVSGTDADKTTGFTLTQGDANNAGKLTIDETLNSSVGDTWACTTSYKADSDAQGAADDFSDGMSVFATFIGVLVLAIVGKFIISMFTKNNI